MSEIQDSIVEGCSAEWEICPCQRSWHIGSDIEYVSQHDDEYVIIAHRPSHYAAHIIVPNVVDGKQIVGIANVAFFEAKADITGEAAVEVIEEIIVAEGIRFLDAGTFSFMSIQKVILPKSLQLIGDDCFSQSSIAKVAVPSGVKHIGKRCFEGCWNLTQLTILANIDVIEREMCASCGKLEIIDLPDSVRVISSYAFYGSGLRYLMLPQSTTTIDAYAFLNCKNLQSISIPRKLCKIHDYSFDSPETNPSLVLFVYSGSHGLMWARIHGYQIQNAEA